jgi:hypothetical protein
MIEVIGPATVVTFDDHVLELFTPDGSRRVHISQLARAGLGSVGLLVPGPTLEVLTVEGDHISVPFPLEAMGALELLLMRLPRAATADRQAL